MGNYGHMVTTPVVNLSTVVDKQHHITKETMLIDISLMLHGVVVVMAQEKNRGARGREGVVVVHGEFYG